MNEREAVIWTMAIPNWAPVPLNRLLNAHWAKRGSMKAHDRDIIGLAVLAYAVPPATRKRRVRMLIIWPKGMRSVDKDAVKKSTLDALVYHGALKNDSHLWCDAPEPEYAKGEHLATYLTLEDVL